jgi:hypothetical protein
MKNVGGKRESLSFYCPDRPQYIENVALGAMFSLSMLEHVKSIHEYSMIFLYAKTPSPYKYQLSFEGINNIQAKNIYKFKVLTLMGRYFTPG